MSVDLPLGLLKLLLLAVTVFHPNSAVQILTGDQLEIAGWLIGLRLTLAGHQQIFLKENEFRDQNEEQLVNL